MAWLAVIGVCLMTGIWLFSILNGGGENASHAAESNPGSTIVAIIVLAVLALIGFAVIGSITGR